MENFEYQKPTKESEGYHKIDLVVNGERVGNASYQYCSQPLPYYYIGSIQIYDEYQGKGYGSKIMSYLESILLDRGRAGLLNDDIDEDSPAAGMYKRRGWQEIPGHPDMFVFNLPKGANIAQMATTVYREQGF